MHPQLLAAPLQDVEQELARDTGEHMAAATDALAAIPHINSVPGHKMVRDVEVGLVISFPERSQRAVGEDDTPTVCGIGRVALNDGDVAGEVRLLQQQTAIQTCRACTDDHNFHRSPSTSGCSIYRLRVRPLITSARRSSWLMSGT